MSRDFEFTQILRAYRKGIINEATFDREMAKLEGEADGTSNGKTFRAMGKSYPSERAAVMGFLDDLSAAEAGGAEGFGKWLEVCKTDCVRSGIRMICEREAYHSRVMERRLRELGGEPHATQTEQGRKFVEFMASPAHSDVEKLGYFSKMYGEPKELLRPLYEFVEAIKEDLETKEMLRLFVEDETSSLTWFCNSHKALSAPAEAAAASA